MVADADSRRAVDLTMLRTFGLLCKNLKAPPRDAVYKLYKTVESNKAALCHILADPRRPAKAARENVAEGRRLP